MATTKPKRRSPWDRSPLDPPADPVFTTGQIAKFCRVAPRTVALWFDSGDLAGYRLKTNGKPGDRRVARTELVRFLTARGMPLGELGRAPPVVLVAGCERAAAAVGGVFVPGGFELAGAMAGGHPPLAVVFAGHVGRDLPGRVRAAGYAGPLVWLAGEDGGETPAGCVNVPWPHAPADVRAACGLATTGGPT